MSTISAVRKKGSLVLFYIFLAAVFLFIVGMTGITAAGAANKSRGSGACAGTYFVEHEVSTFFWSLSQDGTFQGSDSSQDTFGDTSHQQGAWRLTKEKEVKATFFFMIFDDSSNLPLRYVRYDADLLFTNDCESMAGTFEVRWYLPTDDPLDPDAAYWVTIPAEVTGRRVNPG